MKQRVKQPELIEERKHWEKVEFLIKRGTKDIAIVSPWITTPIEQILELIPEEANCRIFFRWPQTVDDLSLLYLEGIEKALEENVEVRYLGSPEKPSRLHAKVYFVEEQGGIVTSANLTKFGIKEGKNIELGVFLSDSKSLEKLSSWVKQLCKNSSELKKEQLTGLYETKEKIEEWKKANKGEQPSIPKPTEWIYSHTDHIELNAAVDALEYAREMGLIRCFRHELKGRGQKAFSLNLNKKRENYPVRVLVSSKSKISKEDVFDYDINKKDVADWFDKRGSNSPKIKGFVLVALKGKIGEQVFDREQPLFFIPMDFLFRRNHFTKTPFILRANKKGLIRVNVHKEEDGNWLLKCGKIHKEIEIQCCFQSTTVMKQQEKWRKALRG